eukprot:TRINITY_DN1266_c0_g1_i6.p1 TRINITY_DN1266_c0_g1~~TRINITY_DN1266_c0_g1_i6.p1  ORF type:complete len:116 (-),score=51.78 TRINITY_DN1266_c0_g1_i6:48-395(-)
MIRRPPRSTQSRSSAASDVYKRQLQGPPGQGGFGSRDRSQQGRPAQGIPQEQVRTLPRRVPPRDELLSSVLTPVSYTHLRAHETVLDLVCRLLLEKKKKKNIQNKTTYSNMKHNG